MKTHHLMLYRERSLIVEKYKGFSTIKRMALIVTAMPSRVNVVVVVGQ